MIPKFHGKLMNRNKNFTTNISLPNSVARLSTAMSSPNAAACPSMFSSTANNPSSVYWKVIMSYSSSAEPEMDMYLTQLGPSSTARHLSLYMDSAADSLHKKSNEIHIEKR